MSTKNKRLSLLTALIAGSAGVLLFYQYMAVQSYAATPSGSVAAAGSSQTQTNEVPDMRLWSERARDFVKPADETLKKQLSPLQYEVTQHEGTERPFKNEYWDNKQSGIYVDVVSGEPLFSSHDKFKSGTGWPSFTRPITENAMTLHKDRKLFFVRTELRSQLADSHLGHVFDDGPAPTGQRYCINSAALRFIPKEDLAKAGYGEFLALFETD